MHLISAPVLVPHGELLQLAGDVIGRPGVGIPVGVDAIRRGCGGRGLLRCTSEGGVEAFVALEDGVAIFAIELAGDTCAALTPTVATTTAHAAATVRTAAPTTETAFTITTTATAGGHVGGGLRTSALQ